MNRYPFRRCPALWIALCLLCALPVRSVLADSAIVHAVFFYSPTCGHCHYVITEVLPPLAEQYGDQLQLVGVNISTAEGQALYQAATEQFAVPDSRRGVPTLILGDVVLVGSLEIPEQLPGLIEQTLASGGNAWPEIPGLAEVLLASAPALTATPDDATAEATADTTAEATADATAEATAAVPVSATPPPPADTGSGPLQTDLFPTNDPAPDDLMSKLWRDPAGNALATLVLAGMLAVVVYALRRLRWFWRERLEILLPPERLTGGRGWAVAALCLLGLAVSLYLAYVETTNTTAVCGPIGDCNTVQQSPYARLFGVLPIGVLGVLSYVVMLAAWAGMQWGQGWFHRLSALGLHALALFGTLFSIYLTFLEPFVIGATCAWCLTSAVSITLILLVLARSMPGYADATGRGGHIRAVGLPPT